ncbi:MAG: hypothetical protein D6675_15215 [Gemmatimonadetes bacterium]|nr:MAG: hypothetical protein D6675_15215 [Gemmatimonadota bacterium]
MNKRGDLHELLNEKLTRLRQAYIHETDSALKFKLAKQIESTESELKELQRELKIIQQLNATPPITKQSAPEHHFDAFLGYHREDAEFAEQTKTHLMQDYQLSIFDDWNALISGMTCTFETGLIVTGHVEPWRDNDLARVLIELSQQNIPFIHLVLTPKKPHFPLFLESKYVVEIPNITTDPFSTIANVIQQVKQK